jgi:hypothetical protein
LQGSTSHAADEQREPERDLNFPEDLPLSHADRSSGIHYLAVDGFESRIGARKNRGNSKNHERDEHRRLDLKHTDNKHKGENESKRGKGASCSRDTNCEFPAATRVPDEIANGNGDGGGNKHRD